MGDGHDDLAARAKAGDRGALNALLERHLNTVYRYVSVKVGADHPDLDDIVQDTLIGAAGSIRGMRGTTNPQVAGWLLSIARHKVGDHLRARYRHPQESLEGGVGDSLADRTQPVAERVEERESAAGVGQERSESR